MPKITAPRTAAPPTAPPTIGPMDVELPPPFGLGVALVDVAAAAEPVSVIVYVAPVPVPVPDNPLVMGESPLLKEAKATDGTLKKASSAEAERVGARRTVVVKEDA